MIIHFNDVETEKIYHQDVSRKYPRAVQMQALRRMMLMDAALDMHDLRTPPGNHFEKLTGDLTGKFSIRINRQYRLVFTIHKTNHFYNVEIMDYH